MLDAPRFVLDLLYIILITITKLYEIYFSWQAQYLVNLEGYS